MSEQPHQRATLPRDPPRQTRPRVPLALLSLAVATAFLAAAAFAVQASRDFLRDSTLVPSQVIALNAGGYHPQVAFDTRAGEHFDLPMSASTPVAVGEHVEVRYLPAEPQATAQLNTFALNWGPSIFLGFMGLGFALGGIGELRGWRWIYIKGR